ncbi:hypothetical protein SAMN03080603_00865 [Acetomicrobium thermoterrenum DSM 13490]|jgi:rhodanese-related sulfurtransferase|uniref:ArsR family transcriptional regulator n=1 Tax=Acetomicrobium thermoterrenum DSM 13490 TaxID=1120987 RepID=A0A1H3F2B7_9BACT|nr:rhodanese-like domain-containing protein [Acetomicrobium thermoterrenum]SDX84987.1 hypothetical protein SAMN03080603_00865 [Acetomicrobium thermoterrenum DSM 13490]
MPERIEIEEARKKVKAGEALLVCAYADENKFKKVHLEGAISLQELQSKEDDLPKDKELIFYCA